MPPPPQIRKIDLGQLIGWTTEIDPAWREDGAP
jgi:hypothetical protein